MSSSSKVTGLYRSLLRELRLASKQPRATRSPVVASHLREMITTTEDEKTLTGILVETSNFLKSSRIHAELLKRYNPLHDMTEEERIHASARRVGLDTPVEYKRE